jgi:uncharacterized protein YaaR (DUF327 family)
MARIDDFSAAKLNESVFLTPATGAKTKKTNENQKNQRTKKSFSNFLAKQTREFFPPELESGRAGSSAGDALAFLLDDIHDAGDALSKRPFPDEIKRYRSTIQQFMRYIIDNAYGVKEDAGIPNSQKAGFDGARCKNDPELRKARNKYSSVQIIDQKLDRLAADIMTGQIKQIGLLKSIEEINGLLVDLLE